MHSDGVGAACEAFTIRRLQICVVEYLPIDNSAEETSGVSGDYELR
jgi:hypothetical protein